VLFAVKMIRSSAMRLRCTIASEHA
jgi:hypothetical protein